MIINENFNNCKQKYGEFLPRNFLEQGLPAIYLNSACRFHTESRIPINNLVALFKEWNKYVMKYEHIDVNTLSYETFRQYIAQAKLKHCLPNTIKVTDNAALGRLDNVKDARNIPVESTWCIKARSRFDSIMQAGDELYAIYLPNEPLPFTYNVALIQRGNIAFWNSDNKRQFDYGNDPEKNLHEIFLSKLPSEIYNYLLDRAEKQRNKTINCNKNMNRNSKNVVRLTESKLHNMIKESIKSILKESEGNLEKEFSQWVRMVSTNPQEYGLNYNPMALLRDCYYGIEGNEDSYSETDDMIYDMAEDFANYKGIDNDSMIRNAVKNVAYSNQLWESKKKVVRLSESQLHNIIGDSVKRIINEITF